MALLADKPLTMENVLGGLNLVLCIKYYQLLYLSHCKFALQNMQCVTNYVLVRVSLFLPGFIMQAVYVTTN
jgi:hypothetical protein